MRDNHNVHLVHLDPGVPHLLGIPEHSRDEGSDAVVDVKASLARRKAIEEATELGPKNKLGLGKVGRVAGNFWLFLCVLPTEKKACSMGSILTLSLCHYCLKSDF